MAQSIGGLALAKRVVKGLAIAVGGLCTFVFFASLVGVATGNGWARALVALLLTLGLPAIAIDRALPKDAGKARPGLVTDTIALVLLGMALLFIGFGQPITRPLLVHEGDRLAQDGDAIAAHVVYLLAGVRPVDAAAAPAPPASGAPAHGGAR